MSERLNAHDLHVLMDEPIYVLDKPTTTGRTNEDITGSDGESAISYKGGFARKIVVLVDQQSEEFVTEAEEDFLLKVIKAVNMGMEDIAIVNLSHSPGWSSELQADMVLGFGTTTDLERYEVHTSNEQMLFYGDALSNIMADIDLKRRLWQGLKQMFPAVE